MFKKLNLATKLSTILGVVVFVGVLLIGGITLEKVKISSYNQARELAKEVSVSYSKEIQGEFKAAQATVEGIRDIVLFSKKSAMLSRNEVINLLKANLSKNENITGIYTVWNENDFDNKDAQYVNKLGHDSTGRFIPYLVRKGDKIVLEPCKDYEVEGVGDYYLAPKKTGKEFLAEPYTYNIDGNDVAITSISVPIINENGKFLGCVGVDIKLEKLQKLTETAKPLGGYGAIISDKGTIVAHGIKPELIATNILKIDSELKEDIAKIDKGEAFEVYANSKITNEYSLRTYFPIMLKGVENNWSFVSIIPEKNVYTEYDKLFNIISFLNFVVTLIIVILMFILVNRVIKPIKVASKHLQILSNADFSNEIPEVLLNKEDEIGTLGKSLHKMQSSIRELVEGVKIECANVEVSIDESVNHIYNLNENIEEVAAITEELSSGMEETAASTEEMNATSSEIGKAVEIIAKKVNEGANAAKDIDKRARMLRGDFLQSEKRAKEVYLETKDKLEIALKESKSVEQIEELSNTIMEITAQTNLLALNAAIEAARAGDAGKGFVVVADEIRNLAENSKNAVVEIQKIVEKVIYSVSGLTESANGMMNYINDNVNDDYKNMLDATDSYSSDSEFVKNMVSEFEEASNQILESINNMKVVIEGVTIAANEGAEGTLNIASKSTMVAEKSDEVKELSNSAKEGNRKLIELVSKFKI